MCESPGIEADFLAPTDGDLCDRDAGFRVEMRTSAYLAKGSSAGSSAIQNMKDHRHRTARGLLCMCHSSDDLLNHPVRPNWVGIGGRKNAQKDWLLNSGAATGRRTRHLEIRKSVKIKSKLERRGGTARTRPSQFYFFEANRKRKMTFNFRLRDDKPYDGKPHPPDPAESLRGSRTRVLHSAYPSKSLNELGGGRVERMSTNEQGQDAGKKKDRAGSMQDFPEKHQNSRASGQAYKREETGQMPSCLPLNTRFRLGSRPQLCNCW